MRVSIRGKRGGRESFNFCDPGKGKKGMPFQRKSKVNDPRNVVEEFRKKSGRYIIGSL
jgi:hypothetical protein